MPKLQEVQPLRSRDPYLSAALTEEEIAACPFGADVAGYWKERHTLFSRFDEGIQIDREGLHSVKQEEAAMEIASMLPGARVLDPFCGVGGVAIALARAGKTVIAADRNAERLSMARRNAEIYGVSGSITFLHSDADTALRTQAADSVYLDPPWGGGSYIEKQWFGFQDFQFDLMGALDWLRARGTPVGITVPLNFDLRQIGGLGTDCSLHWFVYRERPLYLTALVDFSRSRTLRLAQ